MAAKFIVKTSFLLWNQAKDGGKTGRQAFVSAPLHEPIVFPEPLDFIFFLRALYRFVKPISGCHMGENSWLNCPMKKRNLVWSQSGGEGGPSSERHYDLSGPILRQILLDCELNDGTQSMVSWPWRTHLLRDGQLVSDHSCRLSDNTRRQLQHTPRLPMEPGHAKWGHSVAQIDYSPVAIHENHINRETHGYGMYCLRRDNEQPRAWFETAFAQ